MSRKVLAVFAVILSLTIVALPACGGDEEPAEREFSDRTPSPKRPPEEVNTRIHLSYRNGAFVVDIEADEDYCAEDRTVTIFEDLAKNKKDKKVGRTESSEDGDAKLKKRVVGRYYASVPTEPSARYGELSICRGKRSQTVVVKR